MPNYNAAWVFTDLDDMLFQTELKCADFDACIPAAKDKQGKSASFCSPQQQRLMQIFRQGGATLIPVTGRNQEAFDRHLLCEDTFGEFRILSHGAVVSLADGSLYEPWKTLIDEKFDLNRWEQILSDLNTLVLSTAEAQGYAIRSRVITDHGIPAYVTVKTDSKDAPEALLHQVHSTITHQLPSELKVHINGRNMALLAPYSSKARAVEYVAAILKINSNDLVIGMGDSLSDIPFLRKTHFGLFPINSQIDRGIQA